MSNFNYMEYHCTKVIEDAEQEAIATLNFHELTHLYSDGDCTNEAIDAFSKYLEGYLCISPEQTESLELLSEYLAVVVGKYLSARSIAGRHFVFELKDKAGMKYFEALHGRFLMEMPESYEFYEDND